MANSFVRYFEDSFRENWDLTAMINYETKQTFKYEDVAREIAKLHVLFEELEIKENDKIAILGPNRPEWSIVFLSVITYGAVVVPILENTPQVDLEVILNHSETKLLFLEEGKQFAFNADIKPLKLVLSLKDYQCLYKGADIDASSVLNNTYSVYLEKYTNGFSPEFVKYTNKSDSDLMMLCYTSGTTGSEKAVMISNEAFLNLLNFTKSLNAKRYDYISYMPLAHVFALGATFTPLITGSCITYLSVMPSPIELLRSLQEVQPNFIVMVPLIIEQIYKTQFAPRLKEMSVVDDLSNLSDAQCGQLKEMLNKLLGGKVEILFTGGVSMDHEVEVFLSRIEFPYVSVYGMTEASIISASIGQSVPDSVGKIVEGITVKLDTDDSLNDPGEIMLKGSSVMLGYYKNPEMTKNSFSSDGWFKTGDLGVFDVDGNLYIKGRCKSMILTSSGQNVYPENIEQKLNCSQYICESVVVQDNMRIIAWVYPDFSVLDRHMETAELEKILNEVRIEINTKLASYEYVSEFKVRTSPFERTKKNGIKRYLYEIKK